MDHDELDRAIAKARQLQEQRVQEQKLAIARQQNHFSSVPEGAQVLKRFLASEQGQKVVQYLALTGKTIYLAEGKIIGVWAFSSYANEEIRFYISGTGFMESRPRYHKPNKIRPGNPKMCCQLWAEQGKDPLLVVEEINKQMENLLK